jgi:3'-phosphoadenosine 5'-phosphosulfate sulfotransferase (PAPS reductase)/FAD synthetase
MGTSRSKTTHKAGWGIPPAPAWFAAPWPWDADPAGPPLTWWDAVVLATSGGKDGQAMTLWLSEQPGFDPGRTWVVHNDTGQEHRGALDKARETAAHAGIAAGRVLVTKPYLGRTLLDLVLARRRWPGLSARARSCTERLKRTPTDKLLRRLGDDARILLLTGERREESPRRAKMDAWAFRRACAPTLNRLVMQWRPMLDWSTDAVFARIARHGQEPLWVYDAGRVRSHVGPDGSAPLPAFSRASCAFCVYLRPVELEASFNLYPALACLATKVEVYIGHRWREDLALLDMWARVYGPGGYRAAEGRRLLALSPARLIEAATGRQPSEMEAAPVDDLPAAAGVSIEGPEESQALERRSAGRHTGVGQ